MKKRISFLIVPVIFLTTIITLLSCSHKTNDANPGNDKQVGGRCEDCEISYVDIPDNLNWQTTIGLPGEEGGRLEISGLILKQDGVTPASGIIMYLYQTNSMGYYVPSSNQNPASRRHGHLRGWLKTNEKGNISLPQ